MNDSTAHHVPATVAPLSSALPGADLAPDVVGCTDALLRQLHKGWIPLDGNLLRRLRLSRYMSQQDLANDCWHRGIQVSIATIKRAECGHPVRFRIARELARCFEVPVERLVRLSA